MIRSYSLIAVFGLAVILGCSGKPSKPPAVSDPKKAAIASAEAALQKMNGLTNIEKDESGRDVYHVQFRSSGPKDDDLPELRRILADLPIAVDFNLNGNEQITDTGLAHLKGWKSLHTLRLTTKKITDAGLANLADLTGLEKLTISNDDLTDTGLVHVGKLTNLRDLRFYSKKITPAGFANVSNLTNLEGFHIGDNSEIGDVELSHITQMSQLRELYTGGNYLSDAGLAQLKHFPELRDLTIFLWSEAGNKVTPKGLANLSHFKKLEKLFVHQCEALSKDMSAFKDLKELRDLNIQSCGQLTPECLANLASLPHLRQARLDNPSDESLKGLQGTKSLEHLRLLYTSVGDEGCKNLAKLTTLKDLNLNHTRVTDAGIAHLKDLTGLKELDLSETKVTPAGIAELKKSLPNTEIKN